MHLNKRSYFSEKNKTMAAQNLIKSN